MPVSPAICCCRRGKELRNTTNPPTDSEPASAAGRRAGQRGMPADDEHDARAERADQPRPQAVEARGEGDAHLRADGVAGELVEAPQLALLLPEGLHDADPRQRLLDVGVEAPLGVAVAV